jgi:hypothetical protein
MMNFGFGLAGIISPFVFGYLIDLTGSWTLPFAGSICLLLLGAGLAFGKAVRASLDGAACRVSVPPFVHRRQVNQTTASLSQPDASHPLAVSRSSSA